MKNTEPRGYPYPECNPPLVKDASDIVQLANLALTIDADIQSLFDTADDNVLSPDGCSINAPGQVVPNGSPITFNTLRFDNSPGAVMNGPTGILTRISGTYEVTYFILTTNTGTSNIKGIISIEGVGDLHNEGLGSDISSPAVTAATSGSVIFRATAGSRFQLKVQNGSSTADITISGAEFSAVRLGPL